MKYYAFIFVVFFALNTFAKNLSSRAPQTLTDGAISGVNHLYFSVVPYAKDAGFSLAYEKDVGENVGFGGQITILPEESTVTDSALGLVSISAQARFHHVVKMFDLYVTPGIGFMKMELGSEDDTTIGASLAVGSLVQVSKQFALGAEFTTHQPWFNEDFYTASRLFYFTSSLTARVTF